MCIRDRLDLEPRWLWPQGPGELLRCEVTAEQLDRALADCEELPAAVYVTSPDYLGHLQPKMCIRDSCKSYPHFFDDLARVGIRADLT